MEGKCEECVGGYCGTFPYTLGPLELPNAVMIIELSVDDSW